ncbi:Lon-like ATP-dependent protease [Methylophilaceae bacterium]|nr:Lon-like ATP-dependent protease [Methylophilaceae bacterium]
MPAALKVQQLTCHIPADAMGCLDSSEFIAYAAKHREWIGQADAEKAARFGLAMQQPGFHLLVIGEPGCGRTSLMLELMHEVASGMPPPADLIYLYHFEQPERPLALRVDAGCGIKLRNALDQFIRHLSRNAPALQQDIAALDAMLNEQLDLLMSNLSAGEPDRKNFAEYLAFLKLDVLENIEIFQQPQNADNDGLLDSYLARFRLNLLVDNHKLNGAPVIYDDDPTLQSLFGGLEGGSEHSGSLPEQMRLHAGNLLRADGGMLMLHLRDLHHDQQSGQHILEKLHRFLRNGRVQIEEPVSQLAQNPTPHFTPEPLPVKVKMVLVATREEFYMLQDEAPDFARFFSIKVDFADDFAATPEIYHAVAAYVARRCEQFAIPHFSAGALSALLTAMHRSIEDQKRISSNLAELQGLLLESAQMATARKAGVVQAEDVQAALDARYQRHAGPEQRLLRTIVDGELMIRVHGREIGQINGLTHIDMGDAGFGSPVRISARCHAGDDGVINIDREVEMTGPNHDKGLFILHNWVSATFAKLTPLSLNASLVFEQEYHGVEGDSASCAELYALLSAISGLPLPQGVAVTGAMNQHGEVMAVGGINEKIEGHFRVCRAIGLDGTQGVLIPARNAGHLVLNSEVREAVECGQFHIHTFSHVLEGLEHLTGLVAGELDEDGNYRSESVLGRVQRGLENFRKIHETNKPDD